MRKLFFTLIIAAACILGSGIAVHPVFAQSTIEGNCTTDGDGYCLLEPLPLGTSGATFNSVNATTTLSDYLNTFFKIGIGIIGVLAVIMLIVGGVQYMTTDAIGGKESGKETITNAIGGLLLALGSYLILVTINPQLISLQFGIHSVNMSGVEAGLPSGVEFGNHQTNSSHVPVDIDGNPATSSTGAIPVSLSGVCDISTKPKNLDCGTTVPTCKAYGAIIDSVETKGTALNKFLKANMVEESTCNVKAYNKSVDQSGKTNEACGLFQQLPATASQYSSACGGPAVVTCDWIRDPANIKVDVCIQKAFLVKTFTNNCKSDWRNLAAAQSGGPGVCGPSADCTGPDEISPINGKPVQKWECPYDDKYKSSIPHHELYNTGYNESRYACKKIMWCMTKEPWIIN